MFYVCYSWSFLFVDSLRVFCGVFSCSIVCNISVVGEQLGRATLHDVSQKCLEQPNDKRRAARASAPRLLLVLLLVLLRLLILLLACSESIAHAAAGSQPKREMSQLKAKSLRHGCEGILSIAIWLNQNVKCPSSRPKA